MKITFDTLQWVYDVAPLFEFGVVKPVMQMKRTSRLIFAAVKVEFMEARYLYRSKFGIKNDLVSLTL